MIVKVEFKVTVKYRLRQNASSCDALMFIRLKTTDCYILILNERFLVSFRNLQVSGNNNNWKFDYIISISKVYLIQASKSQSMHNIDKTTHSRVDWKLFFIHSFHGNKSISPIELLKARHCDQCADIHLWIDNQILIPILTFAKFRRLYRHILSQTSCFFLVCYKNHV